MAVYCHVSSAYYNVSQRIPFASLGCLCGHMFPTGSLYSELKLVKIDNIPSYFDQVNCWVFFFTCADVTLVNFCIFCSLLVLQLYVFFFKSLRA